MAEPLKDPVLIAGFMFQDDTFEDRGAYDDVDWEAEDCSSHDD